MARPRPAALAIVLLSLSTSGVTAWAEDQEKPPGDVLEVLASAFRPPAEFREDFGAYKSPLTFDDGRPVRGAKGWRKRREEILATWYGIMGDWPPLIERPKVEVLGAERRDGFEQRRVRVEVAEGRAWDGYLLVPDGKGPFPAVLVVSRSRRPPSEKGYRSRVEGDHRTGMRWIEKRLPKCVGRRHRSRIHADGQ